MNSEIEKVYMSDNTDRLMSIREVAERMRTSKSFVADLINTGLLQCLSFKGQRRMIRKVTFSFLEEYDGKDIFAEVEAVKQKIKEMKVAAYE